MRRELFAWILLVIVFLLSAKTHGRQYRLERELEGHWSVSFTSPNHPWVESFWFRHRVIYWTLTTVIAVFLFIRRSGNVFLRLLFSVGLSMISAFIVTGLMSAIRLASKLAGNKAPPGPEWLSDALWGSIFFWTLTTLGVVALIYSFRRPGLNTSRSHSVQTIPRDPQQTR